MGFKVRPFQRDMEFQGQNLAFSGAIQEEIYVIALRGLEHRLPTLDVGADQRGAFAIIEEGEELVTSNLLLTVAPEHEPDSPTGCQISVRRLNDPKKLDELVRRQGYDPLSVNFLVPVEYGASVCFDHDETLTASIP